MDDDLTLQHIQEQLTLGVYQYCPNCNIIIFKDGGCNFVECICKTPYCFNCRKIKSDVADDTHCIYGNNICNSH